jgi:hypothetical protein
MVSCCVLCACAAWGWQLAGERPTTDRNARQMRQGIFKAFFLALDRANRIETDANLPLDNMRR